MTWRRESDNSFVDPHVDCITVAFPKHFREATSYTLPMLPRLSRYVNDGRFYIDNDIVENAIRPQPPPPSSTPTPISRKTSTSYAMPPAPPSSPKTSSWTTTTTATSSSTKKANNPLLTSMSMVSQPTFPLANEECPAKPSILEK